MASTYTTNLGLTLPTTGELSGTWGSTVNAGVTSLIDSAIAGTTTLSADADVTLSTTDGADNQARSAVILWTASNGATTRYVTAPAHTKAYIVINTGTGSVVVRGVGPTTGVTVAASTRALVAWNGSDFVLIATGVSAETHAATSKPTPVDADELPLADSAASFGLKKLTWANLKATLATWLNSGAIPGSFTTLSASGNVTSQGASTTGAYYRAADGTTTNADAHFGVNNSVGTLVGGLGGVYGTFIASYNSKKISLGVHNGSGFATRAELDTSGLAVTGALSASGRIDANSVGTNIRVKADGTDAKDNIVACLSNGNMYLGNWASPSLRLDNGAAANTAVVSATGLSVTGALSAGRVTATVTAGLNGHGLIGNSGVGTSGFAEGYDLQVGNRNRTGGIGLKNVDDNSQVIQAYKNATENGELKLNPNGGLVSVGSGLAVSGLLDLSNAASGQIKFPATQVPSADANTLDDYEEGAWTPIITGSTTNGTGTYTVQSGRYTKVGRQVTLIGNVAWSAHTGTGDIQIVGIPFTNGTDVETVGVVGDFVNLTVAAGSFPSAYIGPSGNAIGILACPTGGGTTGFVGMDGAAGLYVAITYFV